MQITEISPKATTEELLEIFREGNVHTQIKALQHPNMDRGIMTRVAKSNDNYNLRAAVADNPNAGVDLLMGLETDLNSHVRAAVAANVATPTYILERMARSEKAKDEDLDVSYSLAGNPNTPLSTLVRVGLKGVPNVKDVVIRNLASRLRK